MPGIEQDDDATPAGVPTLLARAAAISWRFIVVVIAASIVIAVLVRLRVVVLPVVVSLFIATLLTPISDKLRSWGLRPALAAWATMASALLVFVGVTTSIVLEAIDESEVLTENLSEATDEIEDWLVDGPLALERDQVRDLRERLGDAASDNSETLTAGAVRFGSIALEVATGAVLTVVLLFFVLKDGHRAGAAVGTLVGAERGDDLRELGVKAWRTMSGYLRGVAITGVVNAVIIGIGLALLGVPLVVPLMLVTFAGAFIPLVGATAAGVLAAMVALVSGGPGTALAVGALVLVVQQVEGDVLAPLVLGRAVRLHAVTILLSLTAGSVVAGIIGAFLAVPLAAVGKTVIEHYRPSLVVPAD